MRVKDIMTRNPVYISPSVSVTDAKALMMKQKISKLPVLDESKRLVGIITKNDLNRASPSAATTLDMYEIGYLLSKLTVEKVMHKNVRTVSEDEVVEEAARIMIDNGIGCLPVMKGDLLVGIITESDLFNALINLFGVRQPGVRATFMVSDQPGILAKITQAIADLNGNIISLITWEGDDPAHRRITIKASGINLSQLESIGSVVNAELRSIREN
ncbi:CBS domain-containing protein [Treponema parvum]|uniref:CBS domain-containing protein n=1 Tax=Treponema parvum TaxID=138851 RepID=A0A975F2P6_9SPIR|nr:CBS domain-containing protein [Treponema parvum]QTQ12494.1 CBS domain-containing protein [Treponema parvum]QTQ13278.1 CBS domain-containing protein [Treponema parvum]QTQ15512.1 CBS domain-containing protein [Treponema parvum]